jgi:hypothetical protein
MCALVAGFMGARGLIWVFMGIEDRGGASDAAGETAAWPKAGLPLGELAWEGGVGLFLGDGKLLCCWIGGGRAFMPGSSLGAMLELDLRPWLRLMMARWMVGGWTRFCGKWVGPRLGLPVLA